MSFILLLGDLSISQGDAAELLRRLPVDLSPERRAVVETACKLVGKVTYFGGGKSSVIGWDSRWGTLRKVWADGNSTTGTYRPFGLDCSGFANWVFFNVSGGSYVLGHGGGAHTQHTYCTITWAETQPGDIVSIPMIPTLALWAAGMKAAIFRLSTVRAATITLSLLERPVSPS